MRRETEMSDERIIRSIVEKCEFFYDDVLISGEKIIEDYLLYFAKQFDPSERSLSFAFHTGSLCFNVVSVAALMIGCLAYEFSSNDEILAELVPGDMVLFKGERYKWGGLEKISWGPGEPKTDYIVLKQDAKGKNGPSTLRMPYERNKHLVKPYYGDSSVTDGRGIRKDKTNRNDFISFVLGIPLADVPTALDISVVVVADKNEFMEICRHLIIRYGGVKTVELMDVVPVSYYTGSGEQFQIGRNASKAEAVIKVTGKISMARDLVLDRSGNRVIGLMVTNAESLTADASELNDLLRRKSLRFAYVIAPYNSDSCEWAMDQYESANMFACTKELLSGSRHEVKVHHKLTEELNRQISNILTRDTVTVPVDGCWNWDQYRGLKERLYVIKQSEWSGEDRDNFILSTMALLNLFTTAFFSLKRMEDAISAKKINLAVVSPKERIGELTRIASNTLTMRDQCAEVVTMLRDMYTVLYERSPKEEALLRFLRDYPDKKTAIVVPKAYYSELFANTFQAEFGNTVCVSANRFDRHEQYDMVIVTGDTVGKRFDAIQCFSAPEIILFLYGYEEKTFSFRKKKSIKAERKLNARIRGLKGDEYRKAVEPQEPDDPEVSEQTMREFSDLDEYIETMGMFDVRRLTAGNAGGGDYSGTAEVRFIGTFTTGDRILFSRYYSAVVFNQNDGAVTETKPEKLLPGDILVFTKRNDFTSNIVDQIFDQLLRTEKLSAEVRNAAEKAFYWKAALREYKESNGLTYRAVAREMKKLGSNLQEVSIRQWLIEESHIIGPRDVNTMKFIAEVTQDPYLKSDPNGYFEACGIVRHYRREILALIARAINDKLSNRQPVHGSAFEVVYENVEKLSETLELESVFELEDYVPVNSGLVNRPISDSEVLM